jgi:CubicO group peptidase (beta-lactamase class C family)
MVKTFRYLKPSAPIKTTWQYCNITYAIATEVPDQLLGIPFCTYVQDNIWTPLGMNDTYCDHRVARATGDLVSGFGRKLRNDQLTFKDVEAVRDSISKGDGKLDAECRGEEMDLGWFQKDWEMFIGVGGIITCAKDMVNPLLGEGNALD